MAMLGTLGKLMSRRQAKRGKNGGCEEGAMARKVAGAGRGGQGRPGINWATGVVDSTWRTVLEWPGGGEEDFRCAHVAVAACSRRPPNPQLLQVSSIQESPFHLLLLSFLTLMSGILPVLSAAAGAKAWKLCSSAVVGWLAGTLKNGENMR